MNKNNFKTPRLKPRTATINVLVGLMFILFLTSFASAWEFDNVKSYDIETKTATITNAFDFPLISSKIADVQLKSEQHVQVGLGYQKIFEYEVDLLKDYSNFIKETEIYNLNKGFKKENKQIDLKYLTYEDVEVEDFDYKCEYDKEGLLIPNTCEYVVLGKHTETREVWKDLDSFDLKIGTKRISGWTNVEQGDYYEWIPQFAGIKVEEWATWSGNISVGILSYWKLDNNNFSDELNANNGADSGTTNTSGKIGDARYFESSYINIGSNTIDMTDGNFSICSWNYFSDFTNIRAILGGNSSAGGSQGYGMYAQSSTMNFGKLGANEIASSQILLTNTWVYNCVVYDGSANLVYFYANGTADSGGAKAYSSTFDAGGKVRYNIGAIVTDRMLGRIDEVGVWTRALSATEIALLYNEGDGCAYGNESCFGPPDASPVVTLTSPTAFQNLTDKDLTFDCKATNDFLLQNITLYLNNSVNGTNTSVFNNTATTFARSLADGYYSWNCGACDNASQCANGTAQYFWIDTTLPTILVTSGNGTQTYGNISTNHTLNITFTDTNLDDCWINYNGTNRTIPCTSGAVNTTNFTLQYNLYNATIYANDTLGSINYSSVSWNYRMFENNRTFNPFVLETSEQTFILNFSSTSGFTVSNPILIYNGTAYTISNMTSSGNNYLLTRTINVHQNPNETASTNYSFFWNVTVNDGVSPATITTPTSQQNSTPIIIRICDGTYTTKILNFTTRNETIPLNYVANWTFGGYFEYGIVEDYKKNISIQNNTFPFDIQICISPGDTSVYMDADIDYFKSGFLPRSYYLRNALINNETQNISMWLTQEDMSTSIVASIKNQLLSPQNNAIVKLMRYYPGYGVYYLVETSKTDDFGQASLKIVENDVDYRIIIEDEDGNVIHTTSPMRIICTATPCVVEIITGTSTTLLENILVTQGITSSYDYNNVTQFLIYTYSDPTGLTSKMRLQVISMKAYGEVELCDTEVEGASGIISCYIEDPTGEIMARVYRSASPENPFSVFTYSFANVWQNFGRVGLFFGMILTMSLFFLGLIVSPILAGVLSIASMVFLMFTGIVYMPYGLFISLIILITIFLIKIRG